MGTDTLTHGVWAIGSNNAQLWTEGDNWPGGFVSLQSHLEHKNRTLSASLYPPLKSTPGSTSGETALTTQLSGSLGK